MSYDPVREGFSILSLRQKVSIVIQAILCVVLVVLAIAAMSIRDIR